MQRFIALLLYFAVLLAAPCEIARGAYYYAAASAGGGPVNLLANPGYETFTGTQDDAVEGSASDTFTSWTVTASIPNSGYIDSTATLHGGSNAAKLHRGGGTSPFLTQDATVTASTGYTLKFWTRGDGTNALRYHVYDNTNASYIQASTSSGITGTTYTEITLNFSTPVGCVSIEVGFSATVDGSTAYVDDASVILQ